MRPVGAWLERFRRPAGVPAAASEELESELIGVFSTLDEVEEEARAIRGEAAREAARRTDAATVAAEQLLAEWRRRAEVERARAEAERRETVTIEARAIESHAEAEAQRLRELGRGRLPAFVDEIVACVLGDEA